MHYLTVATCIKGEDNYIDDYIKIHRALGVEAFILYDRDGDNLTNKFRDVKDITVIKYPEPNTHHGSHLYTVKHFQKFSRWIAFIDCDQVLFSPNSTDIKLALKEFEPYAELQVAWQTYGNNGHIEKTDGSVYERFTKRADDKAGVNAHSQGICDISRIAPILPPDPHRLVPKNGQVSVDENHRVLCRGGIDGGTPHIPNQTQNKLFTAHYYTKSLSEWIYKNNKLRSDVIGARIDPKLYEEHNRFCNEVEDLRIKEVWDKFCK